MAIKINERLNLVVPLYDGNDRVYAWVHSSPVSREVFEANFLLVSKTFAAIVGQGLGEIAGPRVAAMMLRTIAKTIGEDGDAIAAPLLAEIRRLSNALVPTPTGWETIPLEQALARKLIDDDDAAEVENAIVFFTVGWSMYRRQVAKEILGGAARLWGAQTSSLTSTAFVASLATSTVTATSPEKSTAPAAAETPAPKSPGAVVQIEGRSGASSLPV